MKVALATILAVGLIGCSASELSGPDPTEPEPTVTVPPTSPEAETELFPDVLDVVVTSGADGKFRFDVTLSSPYDTPQRYADAWRVMGLDGTVFGTRELAHDHAGEQPFVRSLSGVDIPAGVQTVIVQGRDQLSGWGGQTVETDLPSR